MSQPQNLADASGITSFLQLPSPPSNEVLLGESFACYIRLINLADIALSNVNVKVRHGGIHRDDDVLRMRMRLRTATAGSAPCV